MAGTPLTYYRNIVQAQFEPTQQWFESRLAACRIGHEAACQEVCGSFLFIALKVAESMADRDHDLADFALIQNANSALMRAIGAFEGHELSDFAVFAEDFIRKNIGG